MSGTWRTPPNAITISPLHNNGGLGDWIASIPALKTILSENPTLNLHVYTKKFFIPLARALLSSSRVTYKDIEKAVKAKKRVDAGLFLLNHPPLSMKVDLVTFAYLCYLFREPRNMEERLYPRLPLHEEAVAKSADKWSLPEKYIVLTTGFTSEVREWKADYIIGVKEWALKQGIGIVYVGDSRKPPPGIAANWDERLKPAGIYPEDGVVDLRNATSLVQAGAVLSKAVCVAGVDNGLLHLAATTDVPIVGGFTSVLPETRLPTRRNEAGVPTQGWRYSVVGSEKVGCHGCQSWMYAVNHDFKKCFYQDKACLDEMRAERFIERIQEWL